MCRVKPDICTYVHEICVRSSVCVYTWVWGCAGIVKCVQWPPWVRCHLVCYAHHHLGQLSIFDLSQVANQPLDQPTHNLCTLCLVYICKAIDNQACHSGVHHLVSSRQDPL